MAKSRKCRVPPVHVQKMCKILAAWLFQWSSESRWCWKSLTKVLGVAVPHQKWYMVIISIGHDRIWLPTYGKLYP